MFAHGLSIALLFGITGEIRKRVPSLDFDAMGGLAKQMPVAAFAFGLGVFAAIGSPGFANFAAEIMIVFGAFRNGFDYQHFHIFQWATLLALWGVVISAIYMLRAYRWTFFGSRVGVDGGISDLRFGFRFPIALLVAASILIGFFPQIAVQRITPTFRNYLTAKE
jgi:NADH-quinone oxidoreductase subunit M